MTPHEELKALEINQRQRVDGWKEPPPCDKIAEVLKKIYSTPSHFIYELLQNADDAGATEVSIILRNDELQFRHNGEPFNWDNVIAILSIGESTKETNDIGKFGIGFKSVFSITDSPKIHSGEFHFQITKIIIPKIIDQQTQAQNETVIILPFNSKGKEQYENIVGKLRKIEPEFLMFVKNILKITWETDEESDTYEVNKNGVNCHVISKNEKQSYILFDKKEKVDGKDIVLKIAFKKDENDKIIPIHKNLFVFFPMEKEQPGINFIIHAPYKTTPSRETIDFSDKDNEDITKQLTELVAESIIKIKDMEIFNVDFIENILPITSKNEHPIYSAIYNKVKEKLSKEAILPATDGSFIKAENAILARGKNLISLLDNVEETAKLFNGRGNWLNAEITADRFQNLRDYLEKQLSIPVITMEKFYRALNKDFMESKNDKWLIDFYSAAESGYSLILRKLPIIRLENGRHVKPGNNVYLPPNDGKEYGHEFNIVKKVIAKNKEVKKLLTRLDITREFDEVAKKIKGDIAKKYKELDSINKDEYLRDFDMVYEMWNSANPNKKQEIENVIKELKFMGKFNKNGEFILRKLENIYIETEELKMWFGKNPDITFLGEEIKEEKYEKFLMCLGIKDEIKIIPDNSYIDSTYFRYVGEFNLHLNIAGLEYVIDNININRSVFLWDLLLSYPFLRGCFQRRRSTRGIGAKWETSDIEDSNIIKELKDKHWLFNKNGELLSNQKSEISLDDLHDDYNKGDNTERLVDDLGMKKNEIEEIEKKYGGKFISTDEYEEKNRKAAAYDELSKSGNVQVKNNHKTNEGSGYNSPSGSDNSESEYFTEFGIVGITKIQLMPKPPTPPRVGRSQTNSENDGTTKENQKLDIKEIGRSGEKHAYKELKNQYSEEGDKVFWENEKGEAGKPYDFTITCKNGQIIYYEIKTKSEENPSEFEMTRKEWDKAVECGNQYRVLLVSNKENVKCEEFFNIPQTEDIERQITGMKIRFKREP